MSAHPILTSRDNTVPGESDGLAYPVHGGTCQIPDDEAEAHGRGMHAALATGVAYCRGALQADQSGRFRQGMAARRGPTADRI
jgi:hypothetical protein